MIEHFNHTERRFVIPAPFTAIAVGLLASFECHSYDVRTEYVDSKERTWSMGNDTLPKLRVRTYNGKESFFEQKLHANNVTQKERSPANGIPSGLESLGVTLYRRSEYTVGETRVTIDRELCVGEKHYEFIVLEVKGEMPDALRSLAPFEDERFSKYKLLSGKWKSELM